ncbi:MAG: creatininase family protein [Chloroflexi bacterium]|nr:creatininase family protein [Chloroflexota bacterium]
MFLPDATWEDVKAQLGQTDLLVYPLGALETYGVALPLGTESYVVEHIARAVGEHVGALVMPTLPLAWSMGNLGFPGAAAISPAAIRDCLVDSCTCLADVGVRRVFYVNGHGPNMFAIEEAIRALAKRGVKGAQIDFWRFAARQARDVLRDPEGGAGHGSELAASLLLAIRPELVRTERFQVGTAYDTLQSRFPDVQMHLLTSERGALGHFGDPSPASAAKGQEIIRRIVGRIAEFLAAWG